MTLTGLMPSLRASIPDQLDPDHWPDHTVVTTRDILVAAVSLTELAHLLGTPFVHVSDEHRSSNGSSHTPDGHCSVLVTTVVGRRVLPNGRVDVAVELPPRCVGLDFAAAHLIGRISVEPAGTTQLHTTGDQLRHPSALPEDATVGDLVAIPWPGAHALKEIRPL